MKFAQPFYLDQDTGIIPELSGKERYYAQCNGDYVFGDSAQELIEKHGPNTKPSNIYFYLSNYLFKSGYVKRNPEYLDRLENLDRVERERLLLGSWYAREQASAVFSKTIM